MPGERAKWEILYCGIDAFLMNLADFPATKAGNRSSEHISYSDIAFYGYGKGESASDIFDFILENGSTTLKITGKDSKYIYYTQSIGDKHYYGMSSITEGNGGYYIFDFLCEQKNKSKYEDKFKDWAASVEIK